MVRNNRIIVISNMYPSAKSLRYGVFVKKFVEAIDSHFKIKKIVLNKKDNDFYKIIGYLFIYLKIFLLIFTTKKKDIIYIHYPLFFSIILTPFLLIDRKIILNFHGSDLEYNTLLKKFLGYFQDKLIVKYNIVVPSSYYKQRILFNYNISSEKIFVYPSGGIDIDTFYPTETFKKTFTIGFVSNFIQQKGWKIFLESLVKLLEEKIDFQVIMIGDGKDKITINSFIIKKKLPVVIQSNLNHTQLAKEYNKMDVFVFPTIRTAESLGLVGLEAMACGVPVIGSKIAGLKGYLKNNINGLFFIPGDSNDLFNKIRFFYNLSKETKEKMSSNAVVTARMFDHNKVNNELINYLNNIWKIK